MFKKIIMALIFGLFLISSNTTTAQIKNKEFERDNTWFILLDDEIVYTISIGKDIKIGLTDQFIAFYGDIIFSNGFEEIQSKEKQIIKDFHNNQ